MSTAPTDCRCKACNVLLAKLDRDGLSIRRNDLQLVVTGDSVVAVTCYRCKTLNVLTASCKPTPPTPTSALSRASAA